MMADILVVDDEPTICLTLKMLLQRRGYAVATAADGATALAMVELHAYDLVLLDLKMPGMNGLEVAHLMCDRHPSMTIMLLTGQGALDDDQEEGLLEGFACTLKTASPQEVLARVNAALAERNVDHQIHS